MLNPKAGAVTAWAPTSLLGQEILQEHIPAGKRHPSHSAEYQLNGEPDSVALMERQPESPDFSFSLNGKAYKPENVPLPPSAFASPRRARSPIQKAESSKPSHPSPLNIGEKLAALQAENLSALQSEQSSPSIPSGRTLQVRHSGSFDGSSYVASSEEEDSDTETERAASPTSKLRSYSMNERIRTRSQDTIMANDRSHDDIDLGAEEQELAMESEYIANGADKSRTADQAGAILGIANM